MSELNPPRHPVRKAVTGQRAWVERTAEAPRPEWRGLFREPDWPPDDEESE